MNLLLQLLPLVALALILAVGTCIYIWRKGRRRKPSPVSDGASSAPAAVTPVNPIPIPIPAKPESSAPISPGPAQILCLHTMGIETARIATALGSPLQEVEIVLKVSAIRQSRLTGTPQLS